MSTPPPPSRLSAAHAAWLYAAATLAMTWPLGLGLTRDIPWDLGDSILNTYILQWGADHLLAFLGGNAGALTGYWSANFFYPEPLALAYSEHLTAQVIQALPVYAATGNAVLAYNLLFLSTFVLSGLGAFLFVREVMGSPHAAFVAGLIFAFTPYRIGQYSHLQVLSSQWMPFALYGLARYFNTRHWIPLTGAVAALVLNNLSCGYFLLYFAPFAGAYALWEVARRRLWRDRRMWLQLAAAIVVVGALTVPFLIPYAEVRAAGFEPRPTSEVAAFSADTFAYATAHSVNRAWGNTVKAFPRSEGELFPGVIPLLLVVVALVSWVTDPRGTRDADAFAPAVAGHGPGWKRAIAAIALAVGVTQVAVLALMVFTGGVSVRFAGLSIRATSPGRTLVIAVFAFAALAWASPRVRHIANRAWGSPFVFALGAMALAWVLSLGPRPTSLGRPIGDWGPYAGLQAYVPGFDGLRVPARFAMIVSLFVACVGAYGILALERWRRFRPGMLAVLCLLFLAEATAAPLTLNGTSPLDGVATPSGRLQTGAGTPAVYRAVGALPATSVLVEFPFGVEDYELRYMLASSVHRRPIVNGYSGGYPASYMHNRAVFGRILSEPDRGFDRLLTIGATHAIVHEDLFLDRDGARVSAWLLSRGATPLGRFGGDRLLALPPH